MNDLEKYSCQCEIHFQIHHIISAPMSNGERNGRHFGHYSWKSHLQNLPPQHAHPHREEYCDCKKKKVDIEYTIS